MSKTAKIIMRRMKTAMTPTTTVILLEAGAAPVERAKESKDNCVVNNIIAQGIIATRSALLLV